MRHSSLSRVVVISLAVMACSSNKHAPPVAEVVVNQADGAIVDGSGGKSSTSQVEGALSAKNSSGRTGSFFLPTGYDDGQVPLMVVFHGSDEAGSAMVDAFRA